LDTIRQAWGQIDERLFDDSATGVNGVSWLPHHHDMGLVGGALVPLDAGLTIMVMSPGAFLMRPIRWLQAMSRHRAMVSAAPDFGYQWCVKRTTDQQRAELDLSNWSVAVTGGEPVRATTLQAFAEAFAPVGFRPAAFIPAYGLTEATLGLTGVSGSAAPLVEHIDRAALGEDRVVSATPGDAGTVALVGCGPLHGRHDVVIADPETGRLRGPDEVGEIWISGPSVAQGYWEKPEETEQTFAAFLAEPPAGVTPGPYLRTGDLGFFHSGELFVTGRCKDLIIIGGLNYYPNDIETTVQERHPALLAGRGAAFSVERQRRVSEQLIVVQEVHRHRADEAELAGVIDEIRAAITTHHQIEAHSVILVRAQRLPTTSNAKIQRGQCRQQFLDGDLEPVAQWHAPPPPADDTLRATPPEATMKLARLLVGGLMRRASRQR
jgi:acyl-CoA synthetase (AMP-forming)/AMP-acid ligase II